MPVNFDVPAQYFYALAASMPSEVTTDLRYRMACMAEERVVLDQLRKAIDSGLIVGDPAVTPEMAARRLRALGSVQGLTPVCASGVGEGLVEAYFSYKSIPPDEDPQLDIAPFWSNALSNAQKREGHLELLLCAVAQQSDPQALIDAITDPPPAGENLTLDSVKNLDPNPPWVPPPTSSITADNWRTLFQNHPAVLPDFTAPGTIEERTAAFLRRLRQFFILGDVLSGPAALTASGPPVLAVPSGEPVAAALAAYEALLGASFTFGSLLDEGLLRSAATSIFPNDPRAQQWVQQAIRTINELYTVTTITVPGFDDALHFSLTEALYARGFTSIADITALGPDEFRDALIGTVAYDFADLIYDEAGGTATAPPPPDTGFQPVNDGTLANCVPPAELSPLGAIAYLHDLLAISTVATCDDPEPDEDVVTLGEAIATRRGPLGDLHVTRANLAVPLPVVDLVNECLEAMVATGLPTGVVYDTAAAMLDIHALRTPGDPEDESASPYAHDPSAIFEAMPERSSPAVPVERPMAYTTLANDFSAPNLPYPQSLDVSRTYLGALGSTRFFAMRNFREHITEFLLDPINEPAEFPSHVWRYPVRIEIAREYLGVTSIEESAIFAGTIAPALLAELYGFTPTDPSWTTTVLTLSEFLRRTGLSYCDFIDLWRSRCIRFHRQPTPGDDSTDFPLCEPCYLDKEHIELDPGLPTATALTRLAVLIRLWRKLQAAPNARYSFAQVCDICDVLVLFEPDGSINSDFIRQLAAFQMLRDDFDLELFDATDMTAGTGADRTHLLALWVGPAARKWDWAVGRLLWHIEHHARRRYGCRARGPEFIKLLAENLTPLSRLAGFDPASGQATWHFLPTHTLRFAEVLSKIYASQFGIGEILYLYTADEHVIGDDPFALPTDDEATEHPLNLPDDSGRYSLRHLRHELLSLEVSEDDETAWTWPRIETSLRDEFGLPPPTGGPDPLTTFAEHFFPAQLERFGSPVPLRNRQYRVPLAPTPAAMWNARTGPFHYDVGASELWVQLPLQDEAVFDQLVHIRQLISTAPDEEKAVRDLYYAPRLELAPLAFVFENFRDAEERLVQEPDEGARWMYFRRQFARCHARCRTIARHLASHVDAVTGDTEADEKLAWRILLHLLGDENRSTAPWEGDGGQRPPVTWAPLPSGGSFAALLGLVGTGLVGEVRVTKGANQVLVWRELRGPMDAFGGVRNDWNAPVPLVVPALDFKLTHDQLRFAGIRNGIAIMNDTAMRLGGVEGFCVTWSGVLLVDDSGTYRFWAGGPTPEGEEPDVTCARGRRWRVTLRRGQKSWILLSHGWSKEDAAPGCSVPIALKRGAYDLSIEFVQCPPTLADLEDGEAQHTGFQLKYQGPDTGDALRSVPFERLFLATKHATLADGIDPTTDGIARDYLEALYTSTLRDVRRTYQRAFKALLFARRFDLSATILARYGQSEIGYLLDHPADFAGVTFYRLGPGYTAHRAHFDFNLLPLLDTYAPPLAADDDRVAPSLQRSQALFDVWERVFDQTTLRARAHAASEGPLWLLFFEASEDQPDDPAQLLRHVGVDLSHASLVLHYYRVKALSSADLVDERWAMRAWHADQWLRRLLAQFLSEDIRDPRPDLWVSDDPAIIESGETVSGNLDLTRFVREGCIETGLPRRYEDVRALNDPLRERARRALLDYLVGMERVSLPWGEIVRSPKQLSDLLLIDVEAGLCERASRVEETTTAVQNFVQRARLGLEPSWTPSPEFILYWDRRFATFRIWQGCVRWTLYRENSIEWDELAAARRTEAFRFLEDELRRATLTVPVPGGMVYWDGLRPPAHPGLCLLQQREPAGLATLEPPREGLGLLGTPERSARRSWLSTIPGTLPEIPPPPDDDHEDDDDDGEEEVPPVVYARLPPRTRKLPLWIEAAIRLGARFIRVAAAGLPPASTAFAPHHDAVGCCRRCGCVHEIGVDEFYFWLVDTSWFDQIEQVADWPGWHDETKLPTLLGWPAEPMVHLMWSRMHNGELQQPRRSVEGVRVVKPPIGNVDLEFRGRTNDSLLFRVVGGVAPPGYPGDPAPSGPPPPPPPQPGFRYDMAPDAAVVVPELVTPPAPTPLLDGLSAYPFFVYFSPGAPLFPLTPFSESMSVASTLRAHCRFEAALKWYDLAFDPLQSDDRWCPQSDSQRPRDPEESEDGELPSNDNPSHGDEEGNDEGNHEETPHDDGPCCRFASVPDDIARRRAVLLAYGETLLDWADTLRACKTSPEATQKARLILDALARILGPIPVLVESHETTTATVSTFTAAGAALNPRLVSLYERTADRLALVHACLNGRRLRNGKPITDMPYFGDDPVRDGWRTTADVCLDEEDGCCACSPYRFSYLIQKANELAGETRSFGASLLAAFEKGDAEYLATVRAGHEHQLLNLALSIRKDQWREADWQVQALRKTKEIARANRAYYDQLLSTGLIPGENDYKSLTGASIASQTNATISEAVGTVMGVIPDVFVGSTSFVQLPLGSKLAGVFQGIARISNEIGAILTTTAGLRLTEAGWQRRADEWQHQRDIHDLEIEQIERQILAAERRRDIALRELNNHVRQIENATEIIDILRDKFTSHQLYLWLQGEAAALYYQIYELARCAVRQAERAFNYERGFTTKRFLAPGTWDHLHEGLLAGERLQLAARLMEKAYCDENVRDYELTKHVSLRVGFAREFLALKLTGTCIVEIPEWLFDLDYPGHYMRRLKSVTMTIPCVVGPYTGVHCRLTLLSSTTRIDPRLRGPVALCCEDESPREPWPQVCGCWPAPRPTRRRPRPTSATNGYVPLPDDPRIVKRYAAMEAVATSSGQNDSGLFELNFRDERYLPFEFEGAANSRWRVELPAENNFFPMDSLSDVVLHLNYTAREGGDVLRKAASEVAQTYIPDDGRRIIDVQRELPDVWHRFQAQGAGRDRRLELHLGRDMFPYLPGEREIWIARLELFVEAEGAEASTHQEVELVIPHEHGCGHGGDEEYEFQCVGGSAWPGVYRGMVDVRLGPLRGRGDRRIGFFRFEDEVCDVSRVFLIVHYEAR